MDRREALKKLTAGAAITIATPMIVTSTAFADSGTVSCLPSPFDGPVAAMAPQIGFEAIAGAPGYVQLIIRDTPVFQNILCPTGYTRANRFRWNVTGPSGSSPVVLGGGGAPITNTWSGQNRVRITSSGAGNNLLDEGSYTVTAGFRVSCNNGARNCWRCATFTMTFTWDTTTTPGVGAIVGPGATSALGAANC